MNATAKVTNKNVLAMINPIQKGKWGGGGGGVNLTLPWKQLLISSFYKKMTFLFYEGIGLSFP